MFLRTFSNSARNIKHNPNIAVCIDCNATKSGDDASRALIEGIAEIYEEDWHHLDEATNIKYFGSSTSTSKEEEEQRPRICIRIKLAKAKITSWTGYDWHKRYKRELPDS